ncbi:MAG: hypothetical protein HDR17_12390 [Lachnospiraceae bacterium]|nr:hypothetical protein [Lachnospiraceae bacterium]
MINWKKTLLKTVKGKYFSNAKTIMPEHKEKKFQVFEVLITETLAIMDPTVSWITLPIGADDGIDFRGTRKAIPNPYINYAPQLILGQIKRRTNSYRKDDFKYDIVKIVDHFNEKESSIYTLAEIIHVISSDEPINFDTLMSGLSYNYSSFHVAPINAVDFFKYWALHFRMIYSLLQNVLSEDEIRHLLMEFSLTEFNWEKSIIVNQAAIDEAYIGRETIWEINIKSSIDLSLVLYAELTLNDDIVGKIHVTYPYNILKESPGHFQFILFHEYTLRIHLIPSCPVECPLGKLSFYTESGTVIQEMELGSIRINNIFTPFFYPGPNKNILNTLNAEVLRKTLNGLAFYVITGAGGLGKSTLIHEAMLDAQNHKYDSAHIIHEQNHENERGIIYELFMFLVNQNTENMPLYEEAYEIIQRYLGCNFQPHWEKPLMDFFTAKDGVDLNSLLEILVFLFIIKSSSTSIFVWISDLHWCQKESIHILQMLLNRMQMFRTYFSNRIILVFEGRNHETVKVHDQIYYPDDWNAFVTDVNAIRLQVQNWSSEDSKAYLNMLINAQEGVGEYEERKEILINNLLNCTGGNPFHMNETVKYLYENKELEIDENGYLHLTTLMPKVNYEGKIVNIIRDRICVYKKQYSTIMDILIILANMCEINRYPFFRQAIKSISSIPDNIYNILNEMGFVRIERGKIKFQHEYYYHEIKESRIDNDENIIIAIKEYTRYASTNNPLDLIALNMLLAKPNYATIVECMNSIISNTGNESDKLEAYYSALQFPASLLKRLRLSMCDIYYNIGLLLIKIGSLTEAKNSFEEISKNVASDPETILYKILADKQSANVCGISLQLDLAVKNSKKALESVNYYIERTTELKFTERQTAELLRQKSLILSRLAVSYWFSGQLEKASILYDKALEIAQSQKDIYAISHVLYEQGMFLIHTDAIRGTALVKKGLDLFPGRAQYTTWYEYELICVEYMIGQLIIWSKHADSEEFPTDIERKIETICAKLGVGISNYEAALCHILNGIRFLAKNNLEKALICFFTSIDCSKMSNMKVLLWKNYLNIAQVYSVLGSLEKRDQYQKYYKSQAAFFVAEAEHMLQQTIQKNPLYRESINALYQLPFQIITMIKKEATCFQPIFPLKECRQIPIYIYINGFCIFIMD